MQLRIVAHDAHFNQPANSQVYPSKIKRDKMSARETVLCSTCSPPATTQARGLFRTLQ